MRLETRSKNPYWDRTLELYVDMQEDLVHTINDSQRYKLVLLKRGNGVVAINGVRYHLLAPSILLLTQQDRLEVVDAANLNCMSMYFHPLIVQDEFTFAFLQNPEYETYFGTTLYQNLCLLKGFLDIEGKAVKYVPISSSALLVLERCLKLIEHELQMQDSDFWPCRSRSYLLEMLFTMQSQLLTHQNSEETLQVPLNHQEVLEIISYMKAHIEEKITLAKITKRYGINKNKLNELFMDSTSMTTMQYLIKLRMELAALLLKDTELPLYEIAERSGYGDNSYFTKVFKQYYDKTPSQFRASE